MGFQDFKPLIEKIAKIWYKSHLEYIDDIRQLAHEAFLKAENDWNNPEKKSDLTHYCFLYYQMRSYMRKLVLEEINIVAPSSYEIAGFKDKCPEKRKFVSDDVLAWCHTGYPSQESYCDRKKVRNNLNEFCKTIPQKRADWIKLWMNDVSFTDIASQYGVSKQCVEQTIKKDFQLFKKRYSMKKESFF